MSRAEQKLVLELCQYKNPNIKQIEYIKKQGVDEAVVLGQLVYHGVSGSAYLTLSESGMLCMFHRNFQLSLEMMYRSTCEQTESFMKTVDSLAHILNQIEVPYAFMQESRLCYMYPLGCRSSNHVNILLNRKDFDAVGAAMYAHGFVQGHIVDQALIPATRIEMIQFRTTYRDALSFVKEVSLPHLPFAAVDLHFSLPKRNTSDDTAFKLLANRELYQTQSAYAYTMNRYDFVLHLCVQIYKEASEITWVRMNQRMSIYKFMDLYVVLDNWNDCDYDQLLKIARETQLIPDLYFALHGVRDLFGITSMPLDQALEYLELRYPEIEQVLYRVWDPSSHQMYRYTGTDFMNRVFSPCRMTHLVPENDTKGGDCFESFTFM